MEFQKQRFGDYVLQDRIGAGGMAEIFLATAVGIEGFEKRLVIKRILPTLSDDEQFVRMFIEEAKLCVALRHPNIVQVHDLGEIDQQYYIAMEYVDGRDLLKTLAACGKKKIGFPTDIALYIVMEVLKGLDYAHRLTRPDGLPLGIIHRDVSPSNVLLSFDGEVKIGDFGIAKASTREKTATGILKGKFGYMAPEQVTGTPIDHKADVFAVGIVLYELLTGHRLFAGKNDLAVLERVRDALIDPPPRFYRQDLDPELERIVLSALARRPEDRFATAGDLHDALYTYVYRSRALVGPAQLGRFMQNLFLGDPEEQERRARIALPPVPLNSRNALLVSPWDRRGDFEENTPLEEEPPREGRPFSFSESVSFSIDEVSSLSHDGLNGIRSTDSGPVVRLQPLGGEQESTVRTEVSSVEPINVGTNAILAFQLDPRPDEEVREDVREQVESLRKQKQEEAATGFDFDQDPRHPRRAPVRVNSSIDTGLMEVADEIPPAAVVERTVSSAPEDRREATVRYDSLAQSAPDTAEGVAVALDSEAYAPPEDASHDGTSPVESPDLPTSEFEHMRELEREERTAALAPKLELRSEIPNPWRSPSLVESNWADAVADDEEEATLMGRAKEDDEEEATLMGRAKEEEDDDETILRGPKPPLAGEEESQTGLVASFEEVFRAADAERKARAASLISTRPGQPPVFEPSDSLEEEESSTARFAGGPIIVARGRSVSGRRERPILLPADDHRDASVLPRRSSLRPPVRRRLTTRAPLSVVNPRLGSESTDALPSPLRDPERDDTFGGPEDTTTPDPTHPEPMPKAPLRRISSGISAALNEADAVDEALRELRSGVFPRAATALGDLAARLEQELPRDDDDEEEEATANGQEQQSRRRLVTKNVVLYTDPSEPRPYDDDEQSIRGITSTGRLEDEGASDLFGVLSVLDGPRDFGPEVDEEMSMETESRHYSSFADSMSRGRAESELQAVEYGSTRLGTLADDESSGKFRDPSLLSYAMQPEEDTASVSDGQVVSISQAMRQISADRVPVTRAKPREISSIALDFSRMLDDDEPASESVSTVNDDSAQAELDRIRGDYDEDATEEHTGDDTSRGPLGGFEPEPTNDDRPLRRPAPRLISASFELNLDNVRSPSPSPAPVRPVSMLEPDPSGSEPGFPIRSPFNAKPGVKGKSSPDIALRAVVERQRPAKEVQRPGGRNAPPTASMGIVPLPATGTPLGFAPLPASVNPRAAASVPEARVSAVPATGSLANRLLFPILALALFSTVAAVAVSMWLHGRQPSVDISPQNPRPPQEAPIRVALDQPPTPPPAPEAPQEPANPAPEPEVPAEAPKADPEPPPAPTEAAEPQRRRRVETREPKEIREVKEVKEVKEAPRPTREPPRGKATLQIRCSEPTDIRLSDGKKWEDQTKLSVLLPPGEYQVRLNRGDKRAVQVVRLVAGTKAEVPCP